MDQETVITPRTDALFQVAFLIAKIVTEKIGSVSLQKSLRNNVLDKEFTIDRSGKLESHFALDDPKALEYYKRLFEIFRVNLSIVFGETFTEEVFNEQIKKVKEWTQTPGEIEMLKKITPVIMPETQK
jgi:hypothetical protein